MELLKTLQKYSIWVVFINFFLTLPLQSNSFGSPQLMQTIDTSTTTPFPCCNTDLKQFLVVWSNAENIIQYMIYNSDSTIATNLQFLDAANSYTSNIIYSVYNSHNQQYFVVWIDTSNYIKFAFLDAAGNVLSVHTTTFFVDTGSSYAPTVNVIWNSQTHEYFVYWFNGDTFYLKYAIFDENGNSALGETTSTISVIDGGFLGSYNPHRNEYFIPSIASTTNDVQYTIFNAAGEIITQNASDFQFQCTADSIASVYNTATHQYFFIWLDYYSRGLGFAICDEDGNVVNQSFLNYPLTNNSVYGLSYNAVNNQFLITVLFLEGSPSLNQYYLLICDSNGNLVSSPSAIPNMTAATTTSPGDTRLNTVFNAYLDKDNCIFISWLSWFIVGTVTDNKGFPDFAAPIFNTYFIDLPQDAPSNFKGNRLLNRFVNYGEYVNILTWSEVTSTQP